ncbi:MAG: YceI family protein [Burkholderiales bacterium]|nr:YceI family protein [Burkholderiales bacterium]
MSRHAFLGALALAAPIAATAAPETYVIDPIHSFAYFGIDHFGVSTVRGRFNKSSGKFTLDTEAKTASLEVVIDTASIDTGDHDKGSRPRSRDEHLRSADFFNVAEFPQMTYKSTAVKFDGAAPAEIEGQLTLLGVSKPVTLKVERWTCKNHPFRKTPFCGGDATASIKRTDFGMKYGVPAIGDEVKISINIEAYKQ